MNVADTIVQALVGEGVRVAAGIFGESIGRVVVGLANAPKIKLCYTRQERVAIDIADGHARVSGVPAVVFADAGPAAANIIRAEGLVDQLLAGVDRVRYLNGNALPHDRRSFLSRSQPRHNFTGK